MAKHLARGTLTTTSGEYQVEVGTTHSGALTFTVLSATLHKAPGYVDSAMLRGKRQGVQTEEDE